MLSDSLYLCHLLQIGEFYLIVCNHHHAFARWSCRLTVVGFRRKRRRARMLCPVTSLEARLLCQVTRKKRFQTSSRPFILEHTLAFLSRPMRCRATCRSSRYAGKIDNLVSCQGRRAQAESNSFRGERRGRTGVSQSDPGPDATGCGLTSSIYAERLRSIWPARSQSGLKFEFRFLCRAFVTAAPGLRSQAIG